MRQQLATAVRVLGLVFPLVVRVGLVLVVHVGLVVLSFPSTCGQY